MLTFTVTNENDDREKILTSLACTFPDMVFTEKDLVLNYISPFDTFFSILSYIHSIIEA